MTAYYNEIDPYAAQWLRNLIEAKLIAPGHVDTRSIVDVRPADLAGFKQCHFFAGLGGWSGALRLAGVADARPLWTGSCPCQPFSLAGKQKGFNDERHLWPIWRELIAERRPTTILGEQVASAAQWLGLVRSDLETMGYAVGAIPCEAASAGADHLRDRIWFVANGESERLDGRQDPPRSPRRPSFETDGLADCDGERQPRRQELHQRAQQPGQQAPFGNDPVRCDMEWIVGADGKSRRVKSGICLLAHGVPARVAKLRALGNAIDLRPAATFIRASILTSGQEK